MGNSVISFTCYRLISSLYGSMCQQQNTHTFFFLALMQLFGPIENICARTSQTKKNIFIILCFDFVFLFFLGAILCPLETYLITIKSNVYRRLRINRADVIFRNTQQNESFMETFSSFSNYLKTKYKMLHHLRFPLDGTSACVWANGRQ